MPRAPIPHRMPRASIPHGMLRALPAPWVEVAAHAAAPKTKRGALKGRPALLMSLKLGSYAALVGRKDVGVRRT